MNRSNRDRQAAKDAENKQEQIREDYAKNKVRMAGYKTKEKASKNKYSTDKHSETDEEK